MSDTSEALPQARSGIGTVTQAFVIALGIMSAVLLARDGCNIPLNEYLDVVANAYDDTLKDVTLFFFEPAINALFSKLREWLSWNLQLHPHWKHVFVLMWLCFRSSTRLKWVGVREAPGTWPSALFVSLWGIAVALIASALSGAVALRDMGSSMTMAFWPVAGFVAFLVGNAAWFAAFWGYADYTRLGAFWYDTKRYLRRYALPGFVALVVVGTQGDKIPFLRSASNPGLLLLLVLLVALALNQLRAGARQLFDTSIPWRQEMHDETERRLRRLWGSGIQKTRWEAFIDHADTRIGLDILTVLGGAAFIVWLGHTLA